MERLLLLLFDTVVLNINPSTTTFYLQFHFIQIIGFYWILSESYDFTKFEEIEAFYTDRIDYFFFFSIIELLFALSICNELLWKYLSF